MRVEPIEPLQISVTDGALADLRSRTDGDALAVTGFLRELVDSWRDSFDWRQAKARLDSFDQFRVEMERPAGLLRPRSRRRAGAIQRLITAGPARSPRSCRWSRCWPIRVPTAAILRARSPW